MRQIRRILLLIAVTIAVIVLAAPWIGDVYLSIETAKDPPRRSRLVPRELLDHSLATAPGTKLSYFGYEFEIPWNDIDVAKTKSYRDMVVLTFRSGLKLMVGATPPKFWLDGLAGYSKTTAAVVEQSYGVHSDYDFLKTMYTLTPNEMHLWAFSPRIHYRETFLLVVKSTAILPEAETGFYYVGNSTNQGFQEGDPQAWPSNYSPKSRSSVAIQLFSDRGCLNLTLFQKDFLDPAGVTQADLNRIIQSVQRVSGSVAGKAALQH
ncbi:MAG: hypothetical protein ACHP8A_12885 [Terriglobales bacterium]|jgi:hypothetical protein|nr:hypothetical protein [Terriglobales bacterium]